MEDINSNTLYINFSGEINPISVERIRAGILSVVQNINHKNIDHLYFLFSSNGGSVNSGIELFNFLKALSLKITMHNTGTVDSIASVVFLAAEQRYSSEHSSFLLHGVTAHLSSTSCKLNTLKELVSQIERDEEKIISIYCKNSGLTEEIAKDIFTQGRSIDLDYAKKLGIINDIKEYELHREYNFLNLNHQ